jgi:hypothetical protein
VRLRDGHRVFDRRREGLAADDTDERTRELNDVGLDASLGRPQHKVADAKGSLLPLIVRAAQPVR